MKKVLRIDSDDQARFSLVIEHGEMIVASGPDDTEIALHDLHIVRIHCEIEVSDDALDLSAHGSQVVERAALQRLSVGEERRIGVTCLRLESASDISETRIMPPKQESPFLATPTPVPVPLAAVSVAPQRKRLVVIDGADQKEVYPLPEAGALTIGNTGRNADIGLHDFYVSGIHSCLEIKGDTIVVTHNEGKNGTLINGQRITQPQELCLGDVLRVGNSHLRLEVADTADDAATSARPKRDGSQSLSRTTSSVVSLAPTTPSQPARADDAPVPANPLQGLEGQALGHYLLGSMLGSGHTGQVFRAQDNRNNQIVALKVLAAEFPASPGELQQFAQALKIATPLRHPNLITLFAAGKTGARCWIAREFVDGDSADCLVGRLKEEAKLNWMRGLRVALHLGNALVFLHEHKAVHGNITPRNVLIAGEDKATKLADLMLAKALSGSQLHNAVLEKKLLSELPYMAPEQVEPEAFIDQLADLYALGAVVYSFITGEAPFAASSPEKLIAKIREAPVVKPSRFQPKIPFAFESIVLKLLAKRQEDRYQTATELMADLDVLAHEHQIRV